MIINWTVVYDYDRWGSVGVQLILFGQKSLLSVILCNINNISCTITGIVLLKYHILCCNTNKHCKY